MDCFSVNLGQHYSHAGITEIWDVLKLVRSNKTEKICAVVKMSFLKKKREIWDAVKTSFVKQDREICVVVSRASFQLG